MRIGPMRRRALAREQSGAAEQEGAGANARHPPRVRGLPRDKIDRRAVVQRVGHALPAGDAENIGLRRRRKILSRKYRKAAIGRDRVAHGRAWWKEGGGTMM